MTFRATTSGSNLSPTLIDGFYTYTFALPAGAITGDMLVFGAFFETGIAYASSGDDPILIAKSSISVRRNHSIVNGVFISGIGMITADILNQGSITILCKTSYGNYMYITSVYYDVINQQSGASKLSYQNALPAEIGYESINFIFKCSDINGVWAFSPATDGSAFLFSSNISNASTKGGLLFTRQNDVGGTTFGTTTPNGSCSGNTLSDGIDQGYFLVPVVQIPRICAVKAADSTYPSGPFGFYDSIESLVITDRSLFLSLSFSKHHDSSQKPPNNLSSDLTYSAARLNAVDLSITGKAIAANSYTCCLAFLGVLYEYETIISYIFLTDQSITTPRLSFEDIGISVNIAGRASTEVGDYSRCSLIQITSAANLEAATSAHNGSSDYDGSFSLPQANPIALKTSKLPGYGIAFMILSWCDSGVVNAAITAPAGYTVIDSIQDSTLNGAAGMIAYKIVNSLDDHGGYFTVGNSSGSNRGWKQAGFILASTGVAKGARFRKSGS